MAKNWNKGKAIWEAYKRNWRGCPKKIVVDGVIFNMRYWLNSYDEYHGHTVGSGHTAKKCPIRADISSDSYDGFVNNFRGKIKKKKMKVWC